jgi:hypothetical protein
MRASCSALRPFSQRPRHIKLWLLMFSFFYYYDSAGSIQLGPGNSLRLAKKRSSKVQIRHTIVTELLVAPQSSSSVLWRCSRQGAANK